MRILSKHIHFKSNTFVVREQLDAIITISIQVRMALEQDTDDAWNLFNLINIGDLIKGSAYRQVLNQDVLWKLIMQENSEGDTYRDGI